MLSSPLLPLAIALAGLGADVTGAHHAALYLVLLAIPAAAGAALAAAGDVIDGRYTVARALCTGGALVLLIVSSASRSNAPAGASVPTIAVSALIGCVLAYGLLGVAWLARPLKDERRHLRRPDGVPARGR